jgi:hypothetical protein
MRKKKKLPMPKSSADWTGSFQWRMEETAMARIRN